MYPPKNRSSKRLNVLVINIDHKDGTIHLPSWRIPRPLGRGGSRGFISLVLDIFLNHIKWCAATGGGEV